MSSPIAPETLERLDPNTLRLLLAYLNLPPVGALADGAGHPDLGSDAGYELAASLRAVLGERRARAGQFSDARDLLGIDGFDEAELTALVQRLGDGRRYGHRMRSVWGGPEGEREFFALLETATRYIHIETFIVGGEIGLRLVNLLARKLREGVKVRLLFCASGFIISGTPSGTGFVSSLSELRSFLVNDMYVRRRLVHFMRENGVPFLNASPIGRHFKRSDLRRQGVRGPRGYQAWQRARGVPDAWLAEQAIIDRQCGLAFSNVDHRKMVIVDGERAFIGSQNIADSYFYSNQLDPDPRVNVRRWQWHDNSTIIEGGCIAEMNRLFAQRWILSGGDLFEPNDSFYTPPPRQLGDGVVTLEASIPGMLRMAWPANLPRLLMSLLGADRRPLTEGSNPIRNRIMRLPELAREEMVVEHCYPCDGELLEHWATVAPRVPSFTMIVPRHYDTLTLGVECDRFFPALSAAGINLQTYRPAILHSKLALVDKFYIATGSYNLTLRSGRADLEAQFFIQSAEYGRELHRRLAEDLNLCEPARPNALARLRSRRSIPLVDATIRYLLF